MTHNNKSHEHGDPLILSGHTVEEWRAHGFTDEEIVEMRADFEKSARWQLHVAMREAERNFVIGLQPLADMMQKSADEFTRALRRVGEQLRRR